MITQKILSDENYLTNKYPFIVCNFLNKEIPVGVMVGSYNCQNCLNFISINENEVICKGVKLVKNIHNSQ